MERRDPAAVQDDSNCPFDILAGARFVSTGKVDMRNDAQAGKHRKLCSIAKSRTKRNPPASNLCENYQRFRYLDACDPPTNFDITQLFHDVNESIVYFSIRQYVKPTVLPRE